MATGVPAALRGPPRSTGRHTPERAPEHDPHDSSPARDLAHAGRRNATRPATSIAKAALALNLLNSNTFHSHTTSADTSHSTATLLLEQGVELVVIKELLGHAHIGVTATVYAHVRLRLRLRLQRQAIDALSDALRAPTPSATELGDGDEPPLCAALVR